MAANLIQAQFGTPIVFADATDFDSGTHGFIQTIQMDTTALASTKARQSVKANLGANAAPEYAVRVGLDYAVAPAIGAIAQVGFSWSHSATAGTGNDAGASGTDLAYKDSSEVEWFAQLLDWFNMTLTADTGSQIATLGILTPKSRYVSAILHNIGGQALHATDVLNVFIALIPITPEIE